MLNGFASAIKISVFGTSDMSAFTSAEKRLNTFAGSFENASQRVKKAGMQTMMVGLGIAAALAGPAIQTAKFNTQIATTGGLLGVTGDRLEMVASTAEHFGATSMFTANAIAQGQEALVRLGLSAEDVASHTGILSGAISFATGQQKEMAEAGTFLVGSLNAFQQPMEHATQLADQFTTTISRSGNNFDTLQEFMRGAAGTAHSYGQSMESLLTISGVLADRQELGARAGTRLSATMTKIYTQGKKVRDVLGVNVYDQTTGAARDMIEVFGDMQGALSGMSEEAKNETLSGIFGQEGIKVFNLLLSSSRSEMMELRGRIANSAGAAQLFNDTLLHTPKGQWELMKSAISGVSMRIGKYLMPGVMKLMGAVRGVADAVLGWMSAHPVLTKIGVVMAAVGAVAVTTAGGVMMVAGSMLMMSSVAIRLPAEITRVAFAMKLVNSQSAGMVKSLLAIGGQVMKIALPIGIAVAAVMVLAKAWETNFLGFRDTVEEVWFAVKPLVMSFAKGFMALGSVIKMVFQVTIGAAMKWTAQWYASITGGIPPILRLAAIVAWGLGFMVGTIQRAWNWIKDNPIISGLLFASLVSASWPAISSMITAVWTFATQTVAANIRAAGGFLVSRAAMLKNAVMSAWANRQFLMVRGSIVAVAVANKLVAAAQWIWNAAMSANPIGLIIAGVSLLVAGIMLLWKNSAAFRGFFIGMWEGFKTVLLAYYKFWKFIFSSIWSGIKAYIGGVITMLNGMIKAANRLPGIEIPLIPTLKSGDTKTEVAGTSALGMGAAASSAAKEQLAADVTAAGVSPAATIQNHSASSSSVDRSVKVDRIEIQSGPNEPAHSVKEQLHQAFRELAGQDEGIEGVVYAGA